MSKRNITPKSGKQLYINQSFIKGILYTSSEMKEGYTKLLNNLDIAPTGDCLIPRKPLVVYDTQSILNSKYTYAINFLQSVKYQHYISFNNTITESDFIANNEGDAITISNNNFGINMYSRLKTAIQTSDHNISIQGSGSVNSAQAKANYIVYSITNTTNILNIAVYDSHDDIILEKSYDINSTIINEVPSGYITYIKSNTGYSFTVPDGDSGSLNIPTSPESPYKYRLIGVNCPEYGEEWHDYGREIIRAILNNSISTHYKIYGKDNYDRQLEQLLITVNTTLYGETAEPIIININKLLIVLGLANIDYMYENITDTEYIQSLITLSNANKVNIKCEDNTDFDPYFDYSYNTIVKPEINSSTNYIIQAVKLTASSYVSSKVINNLDEVKFIYNDYLDAIGFIGRIVSLTNNKILYKGIIYIRANKNRTYDSIARAYNYDNLQFKVYLPNNDFNGNIINVIDAAQNGYNLLDKELIRTDNTSKTSQPFGIVGLSTIDPNQDELTIVSQGVLGQEINLKATLNESYFYSNSTTTTDKLGYNIELEYLSKDLKTVKKENIIKSLDDDNKYNYININDANLSYSKSIIINDADDIIDVTIEFNTLFDILSYTLEDDIEYQNIQIDITSSLLSNELRNFISSIYTNINNNNFTSSYYYTPQDNYIFKIDDIIKSNNLYQITFKSQTVVTQSSNVKINSITIFDEYNNNYTKIINHTIACTDEYTTYDLINDTNSLLDIKILITSEIKYPNVFHNIKVYDNISNINKTLELTTTPLAYRLVNRAAGQKPYYFFTKWQISTTSGEWETIYEPSSYSYYTESNNNFVTKVVGDNSTSVNWIANRQGNISIKFSIQPKLKASETSGSFINTLYLQNTLQEIYLTIPAFVIGSEIKTISKSEILNNIDFKNATRLGIFNRQVFVYGPYTKSNFIQFSKFEETWYFPFPSHNIEVSEEITWVREYNNSLVIFGKYNLWILTGNTSILECKLLKLYDNLSTQLSNINLINNVGNYMMFFNNTIGYLIVPNTYSDDPSNIKIYKLTDNIANLLDDPEHLIRTRKGISYNATLYSQISNNNSKSYIQNNEIYIVNNYTLISRYNDSNTTNKYICIYIYNIDYKYWKIYDFKTIKSIIDTYICEAPLNNQFIVEKTDNTYDLAILDNTTLSSTMDYDFTTLNSDTAISTYLETGYLSVDTMNEKRFKDIIIELDKLTTSNITLICNFYVDGKPVLISDTNAIIVDSQGNISEISACRYLESPHNPTVAKPVYNIDTQSADYFFGTVFKISSDNLKYSSNRIHLRIPVFGKGRLPSFSIELYSDEPYELINYSIIYKEKNINIRR